MSDLTVHDATERLFETLSHRPWFVSIGRGTVDGRDAIYLYVKTIRHKELDDLKKHGYHGVPVIVEKSGEFRPATS